MMDARDDHVGCSEVLPSGVIVMKKTEKHGGCHLNPTKVGSSAS